MKIFSLPYTSNRIYLLRKHFSNYVYLKDMYPAMKGIAIGGKNFLNL